MLTGDDLNTVTLQGSLSFMTGFPGAGDVLTLLLSGKAAAKFASTGVEPVPIVARSTAEANDAAANADAARACRVAFFGDDNLRLYTGQNASLGRPGGSFFFMPLEDSGIVRNASDAARYTGRAPSAEKAYLNGSDIYGMSFPIDGMNVRVPTSVDAGGWPHFLEGGHTALRLGDSPTAG